MKGICRLRCISIIDSYLFKVKVAKKLKIKVLIFKVGKLWWLRKRREAMLKLALMLDFKFLIRYHGLIKKHRSRVLLWNYKSNCEKALEKTRIE
uniref:Uncharacterized protein n=1 Tax=Tanacetum cinerariifolium TaxID=118510 RepID=A0A699GQC2_TANCI|nr:hypothetical protein [Tanacetum cinerariifolium]